MVTNLNRIETLRFKDTHFILAENDDYNRKNRIFVNTNYLVCVYTNNF